MRKKYSLDLIANKVIKFGDAKQLAESFTESSIYLEQDKSRLPFHHMQGMFTTRPTLSC